MPDRLLALRLVIAGVAGVLLLVFFTVFLGPHSSPKLQAELQEKADAALISANLATWRVEAHGATLELEGVAPSEEAKEAAVEAMKKATGVGGVGAERVVVAPHADPFEWKATKENGRILLEGHGPTRTALNSIHEAGKRLYGSNMRDEASLASGAPDGIEWDVAAIRGLEALVKLQRGTAVLRDGKLTVSGLAASDADAQYMLTWLTGEKGGAKIVADIIGPAEWMAKVEAGRIIFQGRTPSEDAKIQLINAVGGERVAEDKSYVGRTGAWQARARVALPLLAQFEQGEIAVQGNVFRISGEAPGSIIGYLHQDMARIADNYRVEYDVREAQPDMPELRELEGNASAEICQAAINRIAAGYRISFINNRAAIDRSSGKALDRVVAVIKACPSGNVEIQGHTDATGSRAKNIELSRDRAIAVKDYLVERGLSADRLTAVGFGPDRPAASNRTDSGRSRNRRIEFRVTRGVPN